MPDQHTERALPAPFTIMAKIAFAFYAFTAVHALTLLAAGYVWVFTGKRFPPFAHWDDGVILFGALTVMGFVVSMFVSIVPAHDGWRADS